MKIRPTLSALAAAVAAGLMLSGCVAGEGSATEPSTSASAASSSSATGDATEWSTDVLNIDFATYNPLSLIIKEQGWLEAELGDAVTVNWVQSAGSNKANELLRAGAVDFGSTAGSAALLAKSNGSPIQTVEVYTQPEWAAIVVAADSDITSVEQLAGKSIAATKGTDPYFFLLQTLEEAGIGLDEVEVQNLQHADGRAALENGDVAAWSGLDPIMADTETTAGSKLIYRNIDFNTYGFLNARTEFLEQSPDVTQVVINAYEKAREWALANVDETVTILAEVAGIDEAIAAKVIAERTNFEVDPIPGDVQRKVLEIVGPIFVEAGDVAKQEDIDKALADLFNTTFIEKADPSAIG